MADNAPDAQRPPPVAQEQELANNIFPPPPAYYKAFSSANLSRYSALAGPSGTSKSRGAGDAEDASQDTAGRTEQEEQEYAGLRAALDPPRSDWVEEEGRWKAFGDVLSVSRRTGLYSTRPHHLLGGWFRKREIYVRLMAARPAEWPCGAADAAMVRYKGITPGLAFAHPAYVSAYSDVATGRPDADGAESSCSGQLARW